MSMTKTIAASVIASLIVAFILRHVSRPRREQPAGVMA